MSDVTHVRIKPPLMECFGYGNNSLSGQGTGRGGWGGGSGGENQSLLNTATCTLSLILTRFNMAPYINIFLFLTRYSELC